MRTFTDGVEKCLAYLVDGFFAEDRRSYHIEGDIIFEFVDHTRNRDLSQLVPAIREIDQVFPWRDDRMRPDPERYESIKWVSEPDPRISDHHKDCWVTIYPELSYVREGQVYAYETYLQKIAEELAKKKLPGVEGVRCITRISAMSPTFKS